MTYIISSILGFLGFVISLINFIYFFIIRKRNITLCFNCLGVQKYLNNKNKLFIHYRFDNNSQLDIAITRIQIKVKNEFIDCNIQSLLAEETVRRVGKKVIDKQTIYTDTLPINLAPLASQSGFLSFLIPQDTVSNNETNLTLKICTNRGKVIQNTFSLHEDYKFR